MMTSGRNTQGESGYITPERYWKHGGFGQCGSCSRDLRTVRVYLEPSADSRSVLLCSGCLFSGISAHIRTALERALQSDEFLAGLNARDDALFAHESVTSLHESCMSALMCFYYMTPEEVRKSSPGVPVISRIRDLSRPIRVVIDYEPDSIEGTTLAIVDRLLRW